MKFSRQTTGHDRSVPLRTRDCASAGQIGNSSPTLVQGAATLTTGASPALTYMARMTAFGDNAGNAGNSRGLPSQSSASTRWGGSAPRAEANPGLRSCARIDAANHQRAPSAAAMHRIPSLRRNAAISRPLKAYLVALRGVRPLKTKTWSPGCCTSTWLQTQPSCPG